MSVGVGVETNFSQTNAESMALTISGTAEAGTSLSYRANEKSAGTVLNDGDNKEQKNRPFAQARASLRPCTQGEAIVSLGSI